MKRLLFVLLGAAIPAVGTYMGLQTATTDCYAKIAAMSAPCTERTSFEKAQDAAAPAGAAAVGGALLALWFTRRRNK